MDIELTEEEKIKIVNSEALYKIMRRILLRENIIDQNREHQWVVGLAQNNKILFIELIALGTVNAVLVEPMEVFSFALQKRAVRIILVHNHPSGSLKPSKADLELTDRMIQVGKIVNTPVLDHFIISVDAYMSFEEEGLMEELAQSTRFTPRFALQNRLKEKMEQLTKYKGELKKDKAKLRKALKAIQALHEVGKTVDEIREITGLSKRDIEGVINEENQED